MINPSEISKLRKRFNLTQSKLAKISKVSQSYIAKIEQGLIDPAYSKLKRINQAFELLNNKKSIKAKDLMTKKIISVHPLDKIEKAIKLLKKHQISQVLVINDHLLGMVTETDIINNLDKKEKRVEKIMSLPPPIINLETPKELIIELLKYYPIITVKSKRKLNGVITKSDLLK